MTEALNSMGEAGWELVALTPSRADVRGIGAILDWEALGYQAVFKRRKP